MSQNEFENPLIADNDKKENNNSLHKEAEVNYFTFCGKKRRFPGKNDIRGIISTFFLFFLPTCFFIAVAVALYLKDHQINILIIGLTALPLFLITIVSFLDVSTSYPGYQEGEKVDIEEFRKNAPTQTIKNTTFILKYCTTCHIVRKPRCFHCDICGKCVLRHDHHCGFISNCVGKYNTKNFYIFLIIYFIYSGYVFTCSIYMILILLSNPEEVQEKNTGYSVIAAILILYSGMFLLFAITMLCRHTCLISKNVTSNEEIRKKYDYTVFDLGCLNNWKEVFSPKIEEENILEKINNVQVV